MPNPGLVPGGQDLLEQPWQGMVPNSTLGVPYSLEAIEESSPVETSAPAQTRMGVFSQNPGATPKYALNYGQRDNEYRETMARFFIEIGQKEREAFVNSCPPQTRPLAEVLCSVPEGSAGALGFMDFILQNVAESFQEKSQVVETLSDNFILYVFGQQAVPFQYSGTLLNTYQDDQRVWMTRLYLDVLRGTQMARRRKLVRLRYDSVIVSGVLLSLSVQLQGDVIDGASFSFVMMPMDYRIFNPETMIYGRPTALETSATQGGKYALSSTRVPSMRQMHVSSPARPAMPAPQVVRKNDQTPSPFGTDTATGPPKKATEKLVARTKNNRSTWGELQRTTPLLTTTYSGGH